MINLEFYLMIMVAEAKNKGLTINIFVYVFFVQHHPNHTKALILMGDININHLKDVAAAEKV